MTRILVTGGAGLIGSHTVDRLLERGYEVRIYDSLELPTHSQGVPPWLHPDAEFLHKDIRDLDSLRAALDGVDAIVHLAATGGFTPRIADYFDVNTLGTARLLELVRDEGFPVRKIVVASSIAVYGEGKYRREDGTILHPGLRRVDHLAEGLWEMRDEEEEVAAPLRTDERTPVDPATPYAISKFDEERMVLGFGRDTGIATVALRYFVTYGPRQSLHNPYTGVCTIFASRIETGQPIVIYEDGHQTRDFVFVGDVARANVHVLEDRRADGGVFNVGTGIGTTMLDLAATLQRLLRKSVPVSVGGKYRPQDVRHMVSDPTALERLGFRADTALEEGLRLYVDWLRTQGPLTEYFGRAEDELIAAGVVRTVG